MTVRIKKQVEDRNRLLHIVEEKSGVELGTCYQCRKCTVGCPVAGLVNSPPSEIIRRLHLGAGDELLESDLVWLCLSCGTCYARCPMKIDIAAVIDTLRELAIENGVAKPKGAMPQFNKEFLKTVENYGRAYDLSAIMGYKMKTGTYMKDAGKFPAMVKKGKIAILPPTGADKKITKRIFFRSRGTGK
jgi:heterodisulfide reductase subunit C